LTSRKPNVFLPPLYKVVQVVVEEREFTEDKSNPLKSGPHEGVEGCEEYAVYGWAKWSHITGKKPWHLLFRHTNWSEKEYGNAEKWGDRDQVAWIGNGYIHTSTYNFPLNGVGDNCK
jgi:hypothetical protein